MEAEGIIEASDSPWSSPLVIVTKKNGDLRVCVDYRAVNEVMRKSAVPLPKIQECLDSLSGSKYFCKMALAQEYYQVAMHPDGVRPWWVLCFQTIRFQMNYATYWFIRFTIAVFYNIHSPLQQISVLISLIFP